jgi:4-amino-4-deoxy-L-arabinose transferase-like glycosyltransferase
VPARVFKGVFVAFSLYCLLFFGISDVGLLSADEPRYAAIGREMALSGDWVTPRLWGEPWFEKPPLLYWMIALAWKVRLVDEWAARLPVALASLAFLIFYFRRLASLFDETVARNATVMLATSAAWLGFSAVSVTDLPMAACFSAAVLLALPGREADGGRIPAAAGIFLGLAILAKGFVPLVLAFPMLWFWRARWRRLLPPSLWCAAVAAPWFLLCYGINGSAFVDEFIIKHHLARFTSDSLQHVQPWWFYLPVFLAGLMPWTPAAAGLFHRATWQDPRIRQLGALLAFGLIFFSLSRNKLPGYLLPLIPLAVAIVAARVPRQSLTVCAFVAALLPLAGVVLPAALTVGLSRAGFPLSGAMIAAWIGGAAAFAAIVHWKLAGRVVPIAAAVVATVIYLKTAIYPELDRSVSARQQWRQISGHPEQVCLDQVDRDMYYGLAYYHRAPLPDCEGAPRPIRLGKP